MSGPEADRQSDAHHPDAQPDRRRRKLSDGRRAGQGGGRRGEAGEQAGSRRTDCRNADVTRAGVTR